MRGMLQMLVEDVEVEVIFEFNFNVLQHSRTGSNRR